MVFLNEHNTYNKLVGRGHINGKNPENIECGKRNYQSVIKHLQPGNLMYQSVLVFSLFPYIFLSFHFKQTAMLWIPFVRGALKLQFPLSGLISKQKLHIFKLLPSFVKAKIHQKYYGKDPTGEGRKGNQGERL